jgi:hypothetical protein
MPPPNPSQKSWSREDDDQLRALLRENTGLETIGTKLGRDFGEVLDRLAYLTGQADPFYEEALSASLKQPDTRHRPVGRREHR